MSRRCDFQSKVLGDVSRISRLSDKLGRGSKSFVSISVSQKKSLMLLPDWFKSAVKTSCVENASAN